MQTPVANASFVLGSELYTSCQAADPGPRIKDVAGAIDQELAYEGTLRANGDLPTTGGATVMLAYPCAPPAP